MPSYVLNVTKTLNNYGFALNGSTHDPVFTQGYIRSKPNVSIIGSSCFIDYSETTNISDTTYLKKVFKNTPVGTTFSFSDADYFDSDFAYKIDPSGVFSLESLTNNDKLIIGQIISGFTYTTNYKYYKNSNFTSIPQFSTTYIGGTTSSNYIINNITNNPAKSIINAGFIGSVYGKEEYVGMSGSTLNLGKIKINSPIRLKDNRELLYTDTTLTNENLTTTNIVVVQYLRGNANPDILAKSRKQLGCFVVIDANGNQISCYENQNQLQAFLRGQYESSSYSSYWVPCLFCSRLTDNALSTATSDLSLAYDASIFLFIEEQQIASFDNSGGVIIDYSYFLKSNAQGNDNIQTTNSVTFNIDTGFKLDLSHPTLKGFSVNLFLDSNKTIPATENYYLLGIPGYDQAGLIYVKTISSPKKLFVEFNGNSILNLEIEVI